MLNFVISIFFCIFALEQEKELLNKTNYKISNLNSYF